ncbi:unnamed protein product [Lymnaea stagnalis]|uniref:T-box domain-containing protein n=1 Tax=Lymnaea stagnalis TaxID=6523 RepID=A0AAV2HU98_LYMST
MFPTMKVTLDGLDPHAKYILLVDIVPVDDCRYKYHNSEWVVTGKAEPHMPGRLYIHPDSPASGSHWMKQPVTFHKLKLTNNNLDQNGHVNNRAFDFFKVRSPETRRDSHCTIRWTQCREISILPGLGAKKYKFCLDSDLITQLKIDHNPFAKGFRDNGLGRK